MFTVYAVNDEHMEDAKLSGKPGQAPATIDLGWLDNDAEMVNVLLSELPPDMTSLVQAVLSCQGSGNLLCFLWSHPRMALTKSDLAYMINMPEDLLDPGLRMLAEQGAIRMIFGGGIPFYHLTEDHKVLARIAVYCRWRYIWSTRVRRLTAAVGNLCPVGCSLATKMTPLTASPSS